MTADDIPWNLSIANGDQAHGATKPTNDLRYEPNNFAEGPYVYAQCTEPDQADLGRVILVGANTPAFSQRASTSTGWMEFNVAVGGPLIGFGE